MSALEATLIPPPLHVVSLALSERAVTVQARLATAEAHCPGCARPSARVRSTYSGHSAIDRGASARSACA